MDLNYLYRRHGISLHMAQNAACDCSRLAHAAFARAYAAQIEEARGLRR
jgi:hypothetical protein